MSEFVTISTEENKRKNTLLLLLIVAVIIILSWTWYLHYSEKKKNVALTMQIKNAIEEENEIKKIAEQQIKQVQEIIPENVKLSPPESNISAVMSEIAENKSEQKLIGDATALTTQALQKIENMRINRSVEIADYDDFRESIDRATAFKETDTSNYTIPQESPVSSTTALVKAYSDFINRPSIMETKSDGEFITQVFWQIARRRPGYIEGQYYLNSLAEGLLTRPQVVRQILFKETTIKVRMIEEMWKRYYGRLMTGIEAKLWNDRLLYTNIDMGILERKLMKSPEAQFRRKIYTLYAQVLKRSPTDSEYLKEFQLWQEGSPIELIETRIRSMIENLDINWRHMKPADALNSYWVLGSEVMDVSKMNGVILSEPIYGRNVGPRPTQIFLK